MYCESSSQKAEEHSIATSLASSIVSSFLISLFVFFIIVTFFISYKLYIFTLVNKVYDSYYEFLEKDNIHLEAKSTSSAYDGEFVFYELYRNDGKEIITERFNLQIIL